jgi:hypothetical protein
VRRGRKARAPPAVTLRLGASSLTPAKAPASARVRDAAIAVVAVAAIVGAGLLLLGRRREPPARPDPGDRLLSTDLSIGGGGASARFRLRRPGAVEVKVDAPSGAEVSVALGPPLPPAPGKEDLPGDGPAWIVRGPGQPPQRHPLFAAGLYVLRVEPLSTPRPASVHVEVRSVPVGESPRVGE